MSTKNERINTDLFPRKFSDSEDDVKIIDIWTNRFSTTVTLNAIDETKAVDLSKLWTEGPAVEWHNDLEAMSDTKGWTLKDWLGKLKSKFVKKIDQKGNIFTLLEFKKEGTEYMDTFNNRFRKYVSTIPVEMRTDGLVRKICTDILLEIDRDLWWSCTKLEEKTSLEMLMKKTSEIMEIKDIARITKQTTSSKSKGGFTESDRDAMQIRIDNLTKQMCQMALLTQKEVPKRYYSEVTCYNCNKKGHTNRICKALPAVTEAVKGTNLEKKVMIAMKSKENIKINYGGVSSKRPRLVHILNNESNQTHMDYNKIVNLPRLGSVKKSQKKKKRTTGNKVAPNTEWAKRVLESQAPISLKEFFSLKPKLIKDFIKSLQQFEKKKDRGILYAEYPPSDTDSESNEDSGSESDEDEEVPPLSYLTTYVNKEPIPLFLDPGAAYSIISAELLKSLRLYAVNLKAPIKIKP
ncbi:hypothetical protein AYI70_g4249, partial [Smittium culicis]